MNENTKNLFDQAAEKYDNERRALIPCFDDFYGAAIQWAAVKKKTPQILDLGAGTGLLSAMLLQRYPDAKLTLIDFSIEMLNKAKERFPKDSPITYIAADYTDYSFDQTFDVIASSLSIHHLTHERKRDLFKAVKKWLRPGGVFVNADQAAGATDFTDRRFQELWEEHIHQSGLPQPALDASINRRKVDINAGFSEQLQWLREAGFSDVDLVYKYNEFTVFVAFA